MKIASVETIHARHSLSRPTGPAGAYNTARQTLAVKIVTEDGLVGWGETYALPGVRAAIDSVLTPLLVGADPTRPRRLAARLRQATRSGFALGGVDIALHDLWGQSLGVPIWQLLGGAHRKRVPAYASGLCYQAGRHPAEHWVDEARALSNQGFRAVKMRMGLLDPAEELELVQDVRDALPADSLLMVDAWGAYTHATAVRVGRGLEQVGVSWFEEPLPQAGYAGYESLADQLEIPVAGGETLQTRAAFASLLERRAVDVVQPDIAICGGIGEALAVAELANLHGIGCVPHTWNGAIMLVATLHLAAVLPDPSRLVGNDAPRLEVDATENRLIREMLLDPLRLVDGGFDVPTSPGLGVSVDEDWLRRHAVPAC